MDCIICFKPIYKKGLCKNCYRKELKYLKGTKSKFYITGSSRSFLWKEILSFRKELDELNISQMHRSYHDKRLEYLCKKISELEMYFRKVVK